MKKSSLVVYSIIVLILLTIIIMFLSVVRNGNEGINSKKIMYELEKNSIINIEEYKNIVGEILTYREFDDTAKFLIEEKYKGVVSKSVFNQLDGLTNTMKLVYPGVRNESIDTKDGEYPIYDNRLNIVDYGTYEEYLGSIVEFYKLDLNIIENIEASHNRIIVKVVNRYNGVFYLYGTLSNGELTYINILR